VSLSRRTYPDVGRVVFGRANVVHNLIRSEESQSIGIILKILNYPKNSRQVTFVIRACGVGAVNALATERRIDINDHIDSDGIEDASTLVVVESWVDVVDANGVCAEPLEEGSITKTYGSVAERISFVLRIVSILASRLTGDLG